MNSFSILVINCGSSSLKFSLIGFPQQNTLASGLAEKLGQQDAAISVKIAGQKTQSSLANADHAQALTQVFSVLAEQNIELSSIQAVGHRVVHGGDQFAKPVVINSQVLKQIEQCSSLAPLHNPANLLGIEVCQSLLPNTPQVAVFDTAFHQTLDKTHFMYALPHNWYSKYGVRKYGFHGSSHEYVSQQAIKVLGLESQQSGLLIAHLGNGASATAVKDGKSVDTTMGLTPLEGLMMGTRSGDIDPSIHHFMAHVANLSLDEINDILNKQSGLLGISEQSNDMRTLIELAEQGNEQCALAIDMFCLKLAKQLMSLAVSLDRLDALVFTGGIGENSALIRAKTVAHLNHFGFAVDADKNNNNSEQISRADSKAILVINTDEELQIASHCLAFLN